MAQDTCCIDQKSTIEVHEAINSMFRWYSSAVFCIAYLADVSAADGIGTAEVMSQFRRSEWFERGWTLQELLAPRFVVFLSQEWKPIGHKGALSSDDCRLRFNSGSTLDKIIAETTRIPEEVLYRYENSARYSDAEKYQWLQHRETTKDEDHVYCMLGIFGVFLPLIYGEGRKEALMRAQEAIERKALKRKSIFSLLSAPIEEILDGEGSDGLSVDERQPTTHDSTRKRHTSTVQPPKHQSAQVEAYANAVSNQRSASKVRFPMTTVRYPRNPAFVGRADILFELAKKTCSAGTLGQHSSNVEHSDASHKVECPLTFVMHGVGGFGKTWIAREFYYQNRHSYDACFWIHSQNDEMMAAAFAEIADQLDLLPSEVAHSREKLRENRAIKEARAWLEITKRRWLLIFDDVESFQDMSGYLPTKSQCHGVILITSRSSTIPTSMINVQTIHVGSLDIGNAALCLFKFLDYEPIDESERMTAWQLAEYLNCSPLAMASAGAYIKNSQMTLQEYFEALSKATNHLDTSSLLLGDERGHDKFIATVFNNTLQALKPPARELLNVLAFLDPDSVPEEVFAKGVETHTFEQIHSRVDLLDTYYELQKHHLMRRQRSNTGSYVSVHRLLQQYVILELRDDHEKRWKCFQQAFDMISALLPTINSMQLLSLQYSDSNEWLPFVRYKPQLLKLRNHCLRPEPPVKLSITFARKLADMGTYMCFSGQVSEGKALLKGVEEILDHNNAKVDDPTRTNLSAMRGIIDSHEEVSR